MHKVKQCTKCKKVKKLEAFSVNKRNKKTGRQPKCKECNRAYYQANTERTRERVRRHYEENHDEVLERRRELARRPEAKAKKAQWDKVYYIKNKEQISERYKEWAKANRDHLNEYWKEWYHKNLVHARLQSKIATHKRRVWAKINGNNTLTVKQTEELLERHPYCEYCGKFDVRLTIDHIKPLSRGGQNCIENVTMACISCNLSKGDKLLSEWIELRK